MKTELIRGTQFGVKNRVKEEKVAVTQRPDML